MPKMHIDKSIVINKKPAEIYPKLNDFNHWEAWSPWLILEEGVKLNVAEDGKYYDWEGDITGSGNMTVLKEEENKYIEYNLTFLKPWKSVARVGFLLKEEGEGTRVHWTMESGLPFFLFWMKKMMTVYVGMDYERGLNMLKDYCEDGKVHSKLEIKGLGTLEGCNYVGFKTDCTLDTVGDRMKTDYEKLMPFMKGENEDKMAGYAFSIYHKWDPVKNVVSYTAAVPVKEMPEKLLDGMITGSVPTSKSFSVLHTGAYRHAGNPWSAMYSRQRAKKFKLNKKVHPMEVYLNSPKDTPENELKTEVVFAVQ